MATCEDSQDVTDLSLLYCHQNAGHSRTASSARIDERHLVLGLGYMTDDSFNTNERLDCGPFIHMNFDMNLMN